MSLHPCVVPLILGLMAGHKPTSCASRSLGSQISSADTEGFVLGTYGTVKTVKVLPDGHISTPFRFLTFTSIQHCFCTFYLINIQAQHMCPHSKMHEYGEHPPPLFFFAFSTECAYAHISE